MLAACANLQNLQNFSNIESPHEKELTEIPTQLAQLDAQLQRIADLESWPLDLHATSNTQSDIFTELDWNQILTNLS